MADLLHKDPMRKDWAKDPSVADRTTPDTGIADCADPSLGAGEGVDREDAAENRDDPLAQTGTYEGKKVFRANELNQAGEDKEYFHPDDHHRFRVPNDAQHHVLKPDVTLTPGEKPAVEVKPRT
ncbi:hypothetical protein [Asticcacaulis solisilvae]|uniref:hypothetical protein n=1 Tax=Asticcacaulis solisilvae TaxID=1217274 RepID=UPI003FD83039